MSAGKGAAIALSAAAFAAIIAGGVATTEEQSGSFPAVTGEEEDVHAWSVYTYAEAPTALEKLVGAVTGRRTATRRHQLAATDLAWPADTASSFQSSLEDARAAAAAALVGTRYETLAVKLPDGYTILESIEGRPASWATWSQVLEDLPGKVREGAERSITVTLSGGQKHSIPVHQYITIVTYTASGSFSTTRAHPSHPARPFLPYEPQERGPGRADGTSAGLAYAISHMNQVTGGLLLGDLTVHASGVIDSEGRVGTVNGFPAKSEAARRAGTDLLLVPPGNLEEASIGGIRVEAVETLREAVEAICRARGAEPGHAGICP